MKHLLKHIKLGVVVSALAISVVACLPATKTEALDPSYVKFSWSSSVYRVTQGSYQPISYEQWSGAGFPSVTTNNAWPSQFQAPVNIIRNATNPHEILIRTDGQGATPEIHKLSLSEWQSMGSPAPQHQNTVFYKTASDNTIYAQSFYRVDGSVYLDSPVVPISFAEWSVNGFPTPEIVSQDRLNFLKS